MIVIKKGLIWGIKDHKNTLIIDRIKKLPESIFSLPYPKKWLTIWKMWLW
jgi:hypothetical protein